MIKDIFIEENNISAGKYIRYAMSMYMKSWWWAYALPLVACLCLSAVNINFIFVAVVLFFLVFTMILFIVVIYYGLVPESRYSTLPKKIRIGDNGVEFKLKKKIYFIEHLLYEDREPEYDIEYSFLTWSRIKRIDRTDDCLLLVLKKPKFSFVAIPYSAFDNNEHLQKVISTIDSHIA